MKKIKLTDEQKKQHPFATEIVNLFNTYTADDLLEELDNYIFETMSYAADLLNKEVLLGYLPLYGPDEWDDWTTEEKLILFDRWDIINKLISYSKVGQLKESVEEDELDSEDPTKNNGRGMIS